MNDLDKPILIGIWADGEFSFRAKDEPRHRAALPVFSVDTKEQAHRLMMLTCQHDWVNDRYVLNRASPFDGTVDSLFQTGSWLEEMHTLIEERHATKEHDSAGS